MVAALDSAHQAVLNFLRARGLYEYVDKLKELEWTWPEPTGVSEETSHQKVILGMLEPKVRREIRTGMKRDQRELKKNGKIDVETNDGQI